MHRSSEMKEKLSIPTLLTAQIKIEDKIQLELKGEMDKKPLPQHVRLFKIHKKLKDLHQQRYWFAHLSEFREKTDDKEALTQQQVIDHAQTMYLASLNHTYDELLEIQKLLDEYTEILADQNIATPKDEAFIQFMKKCIQAGLKELEYNRVSKTKDTITLSLSDAEKQIYEGIFQTPLYAIAIQLGARFFPLRQTLDPLSVNRKLIEMKGICFGDAQFWSEHVQEAVTLMPVRADDKTLEKHLDQSEITPKEALILTGDFSNPIECIQLLSLIRQVIHERDHVLHLYLYPDNIPHLVLIRKILTTGEIEFRDANFGLFIFSSLESFCIFLQNFLLDRYFKNYKGINIKIMHGPKLNKEDVASLPAISQTTLSDINPLFNVKTHYGLYMMIQTASALIQDNKLDKNAFISKLCEELHHKTLALKSQLNEIVLTDAKTVDPTHAKYTETPAELTVLHYYQIRLKDSALDFLKTAAKTTLDKNLFENIAQEIEKASIDTTLKVIVEKYLPNLTSNSVINEFIKDYEINPACLIVLQQRLLFKLCKATHTVKIAELKSKTPKFYVETQKLFEEFIKSKSTDIPGLLQRIKEKFDQTKTTHEQIPNEILEFMQTLQVDNPTSLLDAADKLECFEISKPLDFIPKMLEHLLNMHQDIEVDLLTEKRLNNSSKLRERKQLEGYIGALQDFLFEKIGPSELMKQIDKIELQTSWQTFFGTSSEVIDLLSHIKSTLHRLMLLTKNFEHYKPKQS